MVGTFFVHSVSYMLSAPFWLDESWVAISTKMPLSQLAEDSASTPYGWDLLLRGMIFGGQQRYRLLPLAFAALAAAVAYCLVRSLPWRSSAMSVAAGALAGVVVMAAPSSLIRNDLKQYTADAFVTLLVLWLSTRLEQGWTRRRLAVLLTAISIGFLFSAAAAFSGAAAVGSLGLVLAVRRQWDRLLTLAIGWIIAGSALAVCYFLAYRPGIPPGLKQYWHGYFLPVHRGWQASVSYLWDRAQETLPRTGVGYVPAVLALFIVGVATLFGLKRPVLALSVPILLVEMTILGACQAYPLLDPRTSHFLVIAVAAVASIGAAGLLGQLCRWQPAVSAIALVAAGAVFVVAVHQSIRIHNLPQEDPRSPARYLSENRQPTDVILLSSLATWGFAYYWPGARPQRLSSAANLQGFVVTIPELPNVVTASNRDSIAVSDALGEALTMARLSGPGTRIWIVRPHNADIDIASWTAAYRTFRLTPQSTGLRGLALVTVP